MIKFFFILFSFLLTQISFANDSTDKKWGSVFTYAPWDTWLPGKWGVTGIYFHNFRTFELGYQRASYNLDIVIDGLAGISEQRLHLTTRSHTFENSFNFQYGVYINSVSAHLGKEYIGGVGAKFDLVEVYTLGGMWGLGNRWILDNGLIIGADWFKIFMPIKTLKNDSDYIDATNDSSKKSDVQDLVDALTQIPQFALIHFEIGYKF